MLEVLEFIFKSLFHWLGTLILILGILEGIADIVRAFRRNKKEATYKKSKEDAVEAVIEELD